MSRFTLEEDERVEWKEDVDGNWMRRSGEQEELVVDWVKN